MHRLYSRGHFSTSDRWWNLLSEYLHEQKTISFYKCAIVEKTGFKFQ